MAEPQRCQPSIPASVLRLKGVMVEGVCALCHEPFRGQACIGWSVIPEGRCLILAVVDESGGHPLHVVAERDIPLAFVSG